MRLLINTASTYKGGGLQVAKSFIDECKKFKEHEYAIILGENIAKTINKSEFPKNFRFHNAPFRPATKVFSWSSHNYFLKVDCHISAPDGDIVNQDSVPDGVTAFHDSVPVPIIGFHASNVNKVSPDIDCSENEKPENSISQQPLLSCRLFLPTKGLLCNVCCQ